MWWRTVVLLAVGALVASCGGGKGDSRREEYIARADRQCEAANRRAKALNERFEAAQLGGKSADEVLDALASILEEGYELQQRDNEAFRDIEPPPEDREVIERLHAAYDEQAALIGRMRDAAESGDAMRFRVLSDEVQRVKRRARALARDYGFKECGSGKSEAD
jgi:hypothetical protein